MNPAIRQGDPDGDQLARRFLRDGYVQLQLADTRRLRDAQTVLEDDFRTHGPPRESPEWGAGRIDQSEAFLRLLDDAALQEALTRLIDWSLVRDVRTCQIALRAYETRVRPLHIDGYFPNSQFLTQPLTGIVAVYLSDVPEPNMGNLRVVPGSHTLTGRYFSRGIHPHAHPDAAAVGVADLPEVQICGPAGTAVIQHALVWHNSSLNLNPDFVREALFFRFFHERIVGDVESGIEAMRNPWRDWAVRDG